MKAFYNEIDPWAAAWTRQLISDGLVSDGIVDERSIADLQAEDLAGHRRVHLFSGIAGWELAIALAGWPSDRPVWTGSCPCQPFSVAGKRKGTEDERHLWPHMRRLIAECRPATVFGEQVASKDGREWLSGVRTDLEALGYAVGAADLCAAGVGAPHIRQRLYWVANSQCRTTERRGYDVREAERGTQTEAREREWLRPQSGAVCPTGWVADANPSIWREDQPERGPERGAADRWDCPECGGMEHPQGDRWKQWGPKPVGGSIASGCSTERLGDAEGARPQGGPDGIHPQAGQRQVAGRSVGFSGGPDDWSNYRLIGFRDGKTRRIESGVKPLVARISGRMVPGRDPGIPINPNASAEARAMRLKGYGNSIVPQLAAVFIGAFLEAESG